MTRRGKIFTAIGLLLLLAALCLTAYNLMTDAMASMQVQVTLEALKPELEEAEASEADMPVKTVDGADYIGLLSLPAISLELPVIDQWSYESLRLAPCRYSGSAYTHNLVILGHNYAGHFRELKKLQPGDAVTFTDMDGNVFSCEVMALETLTPTAVEEMTEGDWDLTLFTCTVGGTTRLAVRCEALDALPARYAEE